MTVKVTITVERENGDKLEYSFPKVKEHEFKMNYDSYSAYKIARITDFSFNFKPEFYKNAKGYDEYGVARWIKEESLNGNS